MNVCSTYCFFKFEYSQMYLAFLLTHSPEFAGAMALSLSEYIIELYFFPWLKGNWFIYGIFFLIALSGQILRSTAMFHAGRSFHHHVQVHLNPLLLIHIMK